MVKVLVATLETQGSQAGDFACAVDGELVYIPLPGCQLGHHEHDAGDGPCGCDRGFAGMASNRLSTTAMVVERLDLTGHDLWVALTDALDRQGKLEAAADRGHDDYFRQVFQRMLATAAHFPIGSILERQGDRIRRRALVEPLTVPATVAAPDRGVSADDERASAVGLGGDG